MFISLHVYFNLCSIWPPCACITIRPFDHRLMAPSIKSWLIVRGQPLPDNLAALPILSIFRIK